MTDTAKTEAVEMPPLPEPALSGYPQDSPDEFVAFSSDQIQAYARAAVLAERERCAKICEDLPSRDPKGPWFNDDMTAGANECAAAIRNIMQE
jgi:hypothetical protein